MPLPPKISDIARIRGAVKFYRVASWVTGIMLLLLVLEMALKYSSLAREIELGGPNGFLALVPVDTVSAVNLSTGILIAHGWLYVVYLFADFRLWSLLRWSFTKFILIALGGVVPLLSFIVEHFITRQAAAELVLLEKRALEKRTLEKPTLPKATVDEGGTRSATSLASTVPAAASTSASASAAPVADAGTVR